MSLNQTIPSLSLPVVDDKGKMNGVWYQFFLNFATSAITNVSGAGYIVFNAGNVLARNIEPASNRVSITNQSGVVGDTQIDVNQANLSVATNQLTGVLDSAQFPTLTGEVTSSGLNITLVPVNNTLTTLGSGDITISHGGLKISENLNPKMGIATLSSGTATVTTPAITTVSRVFLTAQDNNSTGSLRVSARTAGASFTITSSNSGDSGDVAYLIVEPA